MNGVTCALVCIFVWKCMWIKYFKRTKKKSNAFTKNFELLERTCPTVFKLRWTNSFCKLSWMENEIIKETVEAQYWHIDQNRKKTNDKKSCQEKRVRMRMTEREKEAWERGWDKKKERKTDDETRNEWKIWSKVSRPWRAYTYHPPTHIARDDMVSLKENAMAKMFDGRVSI